MVTLEFQASFAELTGRAPCAAQEQTKRQPLLFRTVFNAAEEPEVIHEETYVMFRENVEALHVWTPFVCGTMPHFVVMPFFFASMA